MILASEAVLPLGITAVFASGGGHDTHHAHWGYYMIAAVAVQVLFSGLGKGSSPLFCVSKRVRTNPE